MMKAASDALELLMDQLHAARVCFDQRLDELRTELEAEAGQLRAEIDEARRELRCLRAVKESESVSKSGQAPPRLN